MRVHIPALLFLLVVPGGLLAGGPGGYTASDNVDGGLSFLDVRWTALQVPAVPSGGASEPLDLPFAFPFHGRVYHRVVVGEDGWIGFVAAHPAPEGSGEDRPRPLLPRSASPAGPPAPEAFLDVLRADWAPTARGRIQVQSEEQAFVVRWVRMAAPGGAARATFEAILHPGGAATLQVLELRDPAGERRAAFMGTRDARGEGLNLRGEGRSPRGGLRITVTPPLIDHPGPVQFLQGDCADFDRDGSPDNTAPPWCDTVNPAFPPGIVCDAHAGELNGCGGQRGGPPETDCSGCNDTDALAWHFYEDNAGDDCFCKGCMYTFYILVECGTEMHIPLFDIEGARITIYDSLSGDPLGIRAENECFKDSLLTNPPFPISEWYCDGCGTALSAIWPRHRFLASEGVDCINHPQFPLPTIPCLPWEQETLPAAPEISWPQIPSPNPPPCFRVDRCPDGTGSNQAHEMQVTDVILRDDDGLCGVLRVEIVSGGCNWDLFANCDGGIDPLFRIFHNCGDALAAWNPVPEYILDGVVQGGDCPDNAGDPSRPTVEVTLKNVGCCDESGDPDSIQCPSPVGLFIPVEIVFVDPADPGTNVCPGPGPNLGHLISFDPALVKQKSSATQTVDLVYPCDFDTLPARAIVTVDPTDMVVECSEVPDASKCEAIDPGEVTMDVCACDFFLAADLQGPDRVCVESGEVSLDLDASASFSNPACPNPEFRFYRLDPSTMARDLEITPDPGDLTITSVQDYTFTCADLEAYAFEVEFTCSDEMVDPAGCPRTAVHTGNCFVGDPVVLTSVPDLNSGPHREVLCSNTQFQVVATITGAPPTEPITWSAAPPEGMTNCVENGNVLECDGLPPGALCGQTVTYTAETRNQGGCYVVDTFEVEVTADVLRPAPCAFKMARNGPDLEFRMQPASFLCYDSPRHEVVAYACAGQDLSTCPNGNPPGTGEFNVDNMEADGVIVATGDTVPVILSGGAATPEKLIFYQARSVAACEGAGPLGLRGTPPFNCP